VVVAGRLARIGSRGIAAWELASSRQWAWRAPDLVDGALSPGGKIAIAVDARSVLHVLDADGKLLRQIRAPGQDLRCVAAFPDGRHAATCGSGDKLSVWDVATGRLIAERRVGPVNTIRLSHDGAAMFAYENAERLEGKAAGWILAGDLSRAVRLDHEGDLSGATFSPDGARLATLSFDGAARIWSRDGVLEATLPHAGPVAEAAWSSDGSWLATGTFAGTLTIWDRSSWRMRETIEAHANFINAVAIDGGDTLIATAGGEGLVKIWDVETLAQVAKIPTGEVASQLAFDQDRILISGPSATQAWRCDRYSFAPPSGR
jgi:WD40 repeat protein